MKSIRLTCIFIIGLFTVQSAGANDFEAALSQETAEFTFRSDSSLIGWGGADLALGFFYNEDDDYIFQGSLMQMRQASEETPLTFGVGVKTYIGALDDPDADVFTFAIGGELRYTIPGTMPMAAYVRGFYGPDITSFGDTDETIDFRVGFQIEALPQTVGFVGIRHLEFNTDDDGDYKADDDNIHLGVRLTF
jgi:hypothetical protein